MKAQTILLTTLLALSFGVCQAADTQDEALGEALSAIVKQDHLYSNEYATAIIKTASGYMFAPLTKGDDDSFTLRVSLHKGDKLVALLHSHPGDNKSTEIFSRNDVEVATKMNLPSYIYIVKSKQVKEYIPGTDVVSTTKTSTGTLVALNH
jgi:hypothetical protein